MKHLDLFSGIGGFAYAADQVWDNVEHIFCDNDPFCRQVLKKHWPESEIYDNIRSITPDTAHQLKRGIRLERQPDTQDAKTSDHNSGVDLLTGGFPCQPFSSAGKRGGAADNRFLWPEMFRVIQFTHPTYIIAENVRGILTLQGGLVFEQICLDLEAEGYEVQPFIIPAIAVNAPHIRERVWIVAYRPSEGLRGAHRHEESGGVAGPAKQDTRSPWEQNWSEVAAELCSVDDGVSAEMGDFSITKAQHRSQQIKAYGNAIVPQVAMQLMRGMS